MLISSSVLFLASPGDSSFDELGKICKQVKKFQGSFQNSIGDVGHFLAQQYVLSVPEADCNYKRFGVYYTIV